METCYLCNALLTDKNKSLEHIIPNALGGKLKAYILCKTCNSKMGETIDSNLIKNFSLFNVLTNPQRDRKTKQKVKAKIDGHNVFLSANNKIASQFVPKIIKTENGKNIEFFGTFTDKKDKNDFFKKVQQCINNQSTKQYTLDEIKALSKIETKQPMIYNEFIFSLNDICLGYLKILLGFCALKGTIQHINSNIIAFFKERNLQRIESISIMCNPKIFNNKAYHRIYLMGKQDTKKLFGLVSIYCFCIIFVLNDNYQGENFKEGYCYDIFSSKEIDSHFEIDDLDIEKCYFETLDNNTRQSTNSIVEYITKFTECIAKESKERLTKEQFNSKLCEIIFENNKDNSKLGLFLLNEKVMRDFINDNDNVWFYMLYNSMYAYFKETKPK